MQSTARNWTGGSRRDRSGGTLYITARVAGVSSHVHLHFIEVQDGLPVVNQEAVLDQARQGGTGRPPAVRQKVPAPPGGLHCWCVMIGHRHAVLMTMLATAVLLKVGRSLTGQVNRADSPVGVEEHKSAAAGRAFVLTLPSCGAGHAAWHVALAASRRHSALPCCHI